MIVQQHGKAIDTDQVYPTRGETLLTGQDDKPIAVSCRRCGRFALDTETKLCARCGMEALISQVIGEAK